MKDAYKAKTNITATPVLMLNGSTTTELWLDWVPRAWPCAQSTGEPWRQRDYLAYTRYCLLAFCLAVVTTVMTVATIAAYREWKPYILAVFFIVRVRASGRSTRKLPAEVQAEELEEVPTKTRVTRGATEGAGTALGTTLGSTPTPMSAGQPASSLATPPRPMPDDWEEL